MTNSMRQYYADREQIERAAAEKAASEKIRGIHLELADRYASLANHRPMLSLHF